MHWIKATKSNPLKLSWNKKGESDTSQKGDMGAPFPLHFQLSQAHINTPTKLVGALSQTAAQAVLGFSVERFPRGCKKTTRVQSYLGIGDTKALE